MENAEPGKTISVDAETASNVNVDNVLGPIAQNKAELTSQSKNGPDDIDKDTSDAKNRDNPVCQTAQDKHNSSKDNVGASTGVNAKAEKVDIDESFRRLSHFDAYLENQVYKIRQLIEPMRKLPGCPKNLGEWDLYFVFRWPAGKKQFISKYNPREDKNNKYFKMEDRGQSIVLRFIGKEGAFATPRSSISGVAGEATIPGSLRKKSGIAGMDSETRRRRSMASLSSSARNGSYARKGSNASLNGAGNRGSRSSSTSSASSRRTTSTATFNATKDVLHEWANFSHTCLDPEAPEAWKRIAKKDHTWVDWFYGENQGGRLVHDGRGLGVLDGNPTEEEITARIAALQKCYNASSPVVRDASLIKGARKLFEFSGDEEEERE